MSAAAPQTPNSTKRLSKVPIVIFAVSAIAIASVIFYSLAQQQDAQRLESSEKKVVEASENDSDFAMQRILKQKDRPYYDSSEQSSTIIHSGGGDTVSSNNNQQTLQDLPSNPTANFENRPRTVAPVETKLAVEKDGRFAQYAEMRRESFKRAINSSSKTTISSSDVKSAVVAPPPSDASYQEKMNYYAQMKARLEQQSFGDPNAQYQAKLAMAKNMLAQIEGTSNTNTNNTTMALNTKNEATDWQLHNSLEESKQLTVSTGFVIPAIMVTGINSDLAGSIIAQVSQNVYDTSTGRYLLIPQGTKLFGKYSSQIQFGQERVLVAWNRLIYPDGRTLDIGQMLGADVGGYSGFSDQVNNHYWKLFKGAFLLSMITASVTYADNKYNTGNSESQSATSAMSESLGQNLGDVSVELVRKNMNVSPTLEIRNGYRFNVVVTKDISFTRPYKFQQ